MKLLIGLMLSIALAACAHYEPFEPTLVADIPEGPGLFTGDDGKWILYRRENGP